MKNRAEFEAQLVRDFPNLYTDMHGDMRVTCMAWGIDTGPGWYDIIYELSAQLEKMIAALPAKSRQHVKAVQVKEKYGQLRVYMSVYIPEMEELISEAERKSGTICADCGKPGQLIGDGWYYTACKDCAKPEHKNHFDNKDKENGT
jgi:hypothetical protein